MLGDGLPPRYTWFGIEYAKGEEWKHDCAAGHCNARREKIEKEVISSTDVECCLAFNRSRKKCPPWGDPAEEQEMVLFTPCGQDRNSRRGLRQSLLINCRVLVECLVLLDSSSTCVSSEVRMEARSAPCVQQEQEFAFQPPGA
jgi:hypothetical protein